MKQLPVRCSAPMGIDGDLSVERFSLKRFRLLISWCLFILCLGGLPFLPQCGPKGKESSAAPDFTLRTLTDQEITLSRLRGKVVLLDFWATWCAPCKESIPHLIEMYKRHQDKGFELIGMSTDRPNDAESVRRFVHLMDIPYPIVMAPEEVARKYKVTGLPTTVLIDRKGNVLERIVGFNPAIGQKISMRISELTAETP